MNRTVTITFGDGEHAETVDADPDVAEALLAALRGEQTVNPPQHAENENRLRRVVAHTSRLLQHLDAFRDLAIVATDSTSPYADRKALAWAAAMPPSRLYRILERHGRPKDRRAAQTEQ